MGIRLLKCLSMANLSAIRSMDAGFSSSGDDYNVQQVNASSGGAIDLSGLQTITSPSSRRDSVEFNANGGSVNLSGLTTVATAGFGWTAFNATNSSLSLPSLTSARQAVFTATAGGVINVNGTQPVAYSTLGFWGERKSALGARAGK
jgi:hypothetical protein